MTSQHLGHRSRMEAASWASRARRTAGKVGWGGGPVARIFPPLATLPEPQVLQEGEGDQHHQGVMVQPGPGPSLEVVEAEFFLHLLVRLLADPAGLDRRREGLQGRLGGMAGEVVLPLAAAAPLADQPQLLPRQAVPGLRLRAVGHPHPPGGEAGRERALAALPPADRAPGRSPQGGCDRDRPLARDPMPAGAGGPCLVRRASSASPRRNRPPRGGIDPLAAE